MFRKIVSNLAFSPALVGQLAFYARRLRHEEATRRAGLIFTILALLVQSLTVFSPPEPANASSASDFVPGGVTTRKQYLSYYDRNYNNIKDIYNSLGISRADIVNTSEGTINSKQVLSWGLTSRFSSAQGERVYTYKKSSGVTGKVYYRPLSLWDSKPYTIKNGSTYDAYIGHSDKFGWFAIMKNCGNLITRKAPPAPVTPKPKPQPTTPAPQPQPTPQPVSVASCQAIRVIVSNRTLVQMSGQATTSGNASIQRYDFTVRDTSGKKLHEQAVTTSALQATADNFQLEQPGSYTASLSVNTSLGQKTSPNCQKPFTIAAAPVCAYNPSLPVNSPECQPCPGDTSIWIKDEKCASELIQTKTAANLTQGNSDATTSLARPADRIAYTITLKNQGLSSLTSPVEEKLDDVLEYGTLIDSGGGAYNQTTKTLSWSPVTLEPGQQQSRVFVVRLANAIPAVPQGTSDRTSYDCILTNTFGNSVSINVQCPTQKLAVEQTIQQLPKTGPGGNLLFAGFVLALVTYFYARSRQLKTEVRLIRHNLNGGTI